MCVCVCVYERATCSSDHNEFTGAITCVAGATTNGFWHYYETKEWHLSQSH